VQINQVNHQSLLNQSIHPTHELFCLFLASVYSSQDVKTILKEWYRGLASDAKNFEGQANKVFTWDKQLKENQRTLENIVDRMHGILVAQDDLQAMCDEIEAYQQKISTELSDLQSNIDNEVQSLNEEEPKEGDLEREDAFKLAENLEAAVGQMESTLQKLSTNLSGKHSDTEPVEPIMKVKRRRKEEY
jgi:hypothetical protein